MPPPARMSRDTALLEDTVHQSRGDTSQKAPLPNSRPNLVRVPKVKITELLSFVKLFIEDMHRENKVRKFVMEKRKIGNP